ncbi:MAG TPA: hypothetical protein VF397_09295 [Pyrinomonadaceae bacterium]
MLLTYYLFLVAGLVVLAAFNGSSLLSQPRKTHIGYLLGPPLILAVSLLNFGFIGTVLLTLVLMLVSNVLIKRYAEAAITRATLYYLLGLWLSEAIVPLSIHFALRSRPDAERWSLLISASIMLVAAILVLGVWAPDARKKI